MWVDLIRSAEGRDRRTDWLPQSKKKLWQWWSSDVDCHTGSLLHLQSASPPCRFWTWQPHNHTNEFHNYIPFSLHIHTSNYFCFSGESWLKKIVPLIITSKRIKYLGIYLTKEVQDLYTTACKTLLKEIKKEINVKTFCVQGLEDLILLRMAIIPKLICRFQ